MMRVVSAATLIAATLILGKAFPLASTTHAAGDCSVAATELGIDSEEQQALDSINAIRAAHGLTALTPAPTLTRAAVWKANSMAVSGQFSHDDGDRPWTERLAACGYSPAYGAAENLAAGYESAAAAVQGWVASPGHYTNMLRADMQAVGIARVRSANAYGWYWTTVFGTAVQ
jgi:uncharacterized protein YkwD